MKEKELIKVLWGYMNFEEDPKKTDCMIVLGTSKVDVVDFAVDLYFKGYSDKIIFSGGLRKDYK